MIAGDILIDQLRNDREKMNFSESLPRVLLKKSTK